MNVLNVAVSIPGLLIAIVFHELAHGYTADNLGDPTPRASGRLTFNPLAHLDPIGTLMLIIFHFGWAKPVPINPMYFEDRKRGMLLTALAGPLSNFVLAGVATYLLLQFSSFVPQIISVMFYYLLMYNLWLGVFNLLPIPPLDGSRIARAIAPRGSWTERVMLQLDSYGWIVLLILLMTGAVSGILPPIVEALQRFLQSLVGLLIV